MSGKPGKPPVVAGEEDESGAGAFGQPGENGDALIAAQQAQEAQAQAEAEARAQKEAEDQAERARVKEMRSAADEEVADDLSSKFNDQDDQVVWHPSVDAILYGGPNEDENEDFASHLDKKMGLKKDKDDDDDDDTDDEDETSNEAAAKKEVDAESSDDEEDSDETDSSSDEEDVEPDDDEDDEDPERLSKKKPKRKHPTGDIVIKL